MSEVPLHRNQEEDMGKQEAGCGTRGPEGVTVYRATSLIRNCPPPLTTVGP